MAPKDPAPRGKMTKKPANTPAPNLHPEALPSKKIARRFHWWYVLLIVVSVIAVVVIGLGIKILRVSGKVFGGTNNTSPISQIGALIAPGDRQLKQDENHRTNILVAGYGGPGHDGPYLSDTIILISIDNTTNDIATLSIPRDLLVDLPGYGFRKINNALAFGMTSANPHGGDAMLTQAVQDVTGQTIQYFAKIDFNGFKSAVDAVDGVDITVDNAFADYEYPDNAYGYQTIKFDAGLQHMTGEQALEFVRSRHGTNGEGSDFARSKRQQKLLFALREKALSLGTLTNPTKVSKLLDSLGDHVYTTFELWEVARLGAIIKNLTPEKVVPRVLDTSEDNLVVVGSSIDGAYVIQPRVGLGNWTEIHELAADIFQLNTVQREAVNIQIVNASGQAGLGDTVGHTLRGFGYNVQTVATPKGVTAESSSIVDLSGGKGPKTLTMLEQKFSATLAPSLPNGLSMTAGKALVNSNANGNKNANVAPATPELMLVLGKNAIPTTSTNLNTNRN